MAVRELRDAEVEHLCALATGHLGVADEEDVLRLEIAVDDAAHVRGAERARDLADDAERVLDAERAAAHAGVERLAVEHLHDEVGAAVGVGAEVEDLHDAGVGDRGRGARLVEEAGDDVGAARVLRVEHLDRDPAWQQQVRAEPHFAHAAGTDPIDQPVRPDLLAFRHAEG